MRSFSLDPADPQHPKGAWQKTVYLPHEFLAGTDFGNAMFEADWLLKQYSFGVVVGSDGRQTERHSAVQGFQSVPQLRLAAEGERRSGPSWSRYWIVADSLKLGRHGKNILFDEAKMAVRTQVIVPDPRSASGLRDDSSAEDPISREFSRRFTQHYDELARESPEFARVRELAKAVALAKFMRHENAVIDLDWVDANSRPVRQYVAKVPTLKAEWHKPTPEGARRPDRNGYVVTGEVLYLTGGVDLTTKAKIQDERKTLPELARAVGKRIKTTSDRGHLSCRGSGKPLDRKCSADYREWKEPLDEHRSGVSGRQSIRTGSAAQGSQDRASWRDCADSPNGFRWQGPLRCSCAARTAGIRMRASAPMEASRPLDLARVDTDSSIHLRILAN